MQKKLGEKLAINISMKNHCSLFIVNRSFSLTLLLLLVISAAKAQHKGIGVHLNLQQFLIPKKDSITSKLSKSSIVLPEIYYYKTYRKNRLSGEIFGTGGWSSGQVEGKQLVFENGQFYSKDYIANAKSYNIFAGTKGLYEVFSLNNDKFRFYVGGVAGLYFDHSQSVPIKTTLFAEKSFTYGLKLQFQPTFIYMPSKKLAFDLRWVAPLYAYGGFRQDNNANPNLPAEKRIINTNEIGGIVDVLSPNIQFGARITLADYREKYRYKDIPRLLKPSKRKIGYGLAVNALPFERPLTFLPTNGKDVKLNFSPQITYCFFDRHNRLFQEFYLNQLYFNQKMDSTYIRSSKNTIGGNTLRYSAALGYGYYFRYKPTRTISYYWGTNSEVYYRGFSQKADTTANTNLKYNNFGVKFSFAPTILWQVNKRFFLETRLQTGLSVGYDVNISTTNHPEAKNEDGVDKWKHGFFYRGNDIPYVQVGFKYIFKTLHPTITSYQGTKLGKSQKSSNKMSRQRYQLEKYRMETERRRSGGTGRN